MTKIAKTHYDYITSTYVIIRTPIRCALSGLPLSHDDLHRHIKADRIPIGSVLEDNNGRLSRLNEQMQIVAA